MSAFRSGCQGLSQVKSFSFSRLLGSVFERRHQARYQGTGRPGRGVASGGFDVGSLAASSPRPGFTVYECVKSGKSYNLSGCGHLGKWACKTDLSELFQGFSDVATCEVLGPEVNTFSVR